MCFNFNLKTITPDSKSGTPFDFGVKTITPVYGQGGGGSTVTEYELYGVLSTTYSTGAITATPQKISEFTTNGTSTIAMPSGSYQKFVVSGLPDVSSLKNWELKFQVNAWNLGSWAIDLGHPTKPDNTKHNTGFFWNGSNLYVNTVAGRHTISNSSQSAVISNTKTNYWVSVKYEEGKGYTVVSEKTGSPVEFFYPDDEKSTAVNGDYCIYFSSIQIFGRSISFKSW